MTSTEVDRLNQTINKQQEKINQLKITIRMYKNQNNYLWQEIGRLYELKDNKENDYDKDTKIDEFNNDYDLE